MCQLFDNILIALKRSRTIIYFVIITQISVVYSLADNIQIMAHSFVMSFCHQVSSHKTLQTVSTERKILPAYVTTLYMFGL